MKLRKLTLIAMFAATGAALRIALAPLPQVKPTLAIAIIAGHLIGAGGGLLVGLLSMLVSNVIFGQGPWTLWQMLGAGLVGLLFGIRKKPLNRWCLSIYGGIATLMIYGTILNVASIYMFNSNPSLRFIIAYCIQGLPFDITHALATSAFLLAIYDATKKLITTYFPDSHQR